MLLENPRIFLNMKYTTFFCVALMLITIKMVQVQSLEVTTMDTYKTRINVLNPYWGTSSAGILKSHSGFSYRSDRKKTLTISAPEGYDLIATIRRLDLRPNRQDSLILFVDGGKGQRTLSNEFSFQNKKYYPNEDQIVFYVPKGQLGVTFNTGPSFLTTGYDGFELTYTVQANWTKCSYGDFHCNNGRCIAHILTCDGHNHCGDRSDQIDCMVFPRNGNGRTVGIVSGFVFLLIAVSVLIFIFVRRASRSRTEGEVIITHPPSANLPSYPPSYPQPGTCYPPPPPPYSQGVTNTGYH